MSKTPQKPLSRFDACWLAEAVRLHEQQAANESALEFSEPFSLPESNPQGFEEAWLLRRSYVLGTELGMLDTIHTWRRHAGIALVLLGTLAVISGFTAALSFFGAENRQVNVIWTLLGLIGLPLLALLLWVAGLVFSVGGRQGRGAGGVFGRLWLWLVSRWPRTEPTNPSSASEPARDEAPVVFRAPQVAHDTVIRALAAMMSRSGVGTWLLSFITHSLWLLLLTATLIAILLVLSLRSYGFVLETTILSPEVFTRLVQGFGALPAQIGFAVPDADMITAALTGEVVTQVESARRAWSSWLIGGLLVYAVFPRLLAWGLSLVRLLVLFSRTGLDLSLPGYADLLAREVRRASPGIVDAAPPAPAVRRVADVHRVPGRGAVLLGLELRGTIAWPPGGIANARPLFTVAEIVDSREQRRLVLTRFKAEPPARLLVACDAGLSPDRGALEWLVDVSQYAGELRVWLLDAQLEAGQERLHAWRDSLGAIGLAGNRVISGETAAFDWLNRHD
ncbi:MAG: DUF2868 domain-containing protein [Gammaproteobacteria bacterium]|nr:DUF2868 domain-containing protein [Gammaproteobacteria bacterium]